jgi:hypothetical protein
VLDGVFTEGPGDMLRFQPTPPLTDEEVGLVLATIATRVRRLVRRRGLDAEVCQGYGLGGRRRLVLRVHCYPSRHIGGTVRSYRASQHKSRNALGHLHYWS